MRFLHLDHVPAAVERTFRHSRFGALLFSAVLTAPLAFAVWHAERVLELVRSIPWYAWPLAGPLGLLVLALGALCAFASRELVHAAFLPTNWLVKTSRDGLFVQLRSWQNHHFALDLPTVAFIAWDEIASVRRVCETPPATGRRTPPTRRWLELELSRGDTTPLAEWLAAEARREPPERKRFGVRWRTRYHHVPVLVPQPGVVRVEWLGRGLWKALAERVRVEEPRAVRLGDAALPLEARVAECVARGDELTAIALARTERHVSLVEARSLVERVRGDASSPIPESRARD
ncbi:MAG: hypothetical protein L6Q99_03880 [Planctomycetes bacterium]|nr:hypothetical protein [Planctomycetota bacterium]